MACRITYTKSRRKHARRGFTLIEVLIAMGLTTLLVLVICSFSLFSSRSFAGLFNYVDLDEKNKVAMDEMSRDVRQAKRLKSCKTNATTMTVEAITLEDADGNDLIYVYNQKYGTLTRLKNGRANIVLEGCDRLAFNLGQRNTQTGGYDVYAAASPATCKVINVSWSCSRKILGNKQNTESAQTARIVIRKQGT
jgi:prepilin-type N-terminal cleavage/methylation domain-containing protein